MVQLSLAEIIKMGGATFHLWMKACRISRFLQAGVIQCFSEGDNRHGQCNIPSLESFASRRYIRHVSYPVRVSQLDFVCQDGAFDADLLEFGRA
jgi:hypothetical protein